MDAFLGMCIDMCADMCTDMVHMPAYKAWGGIVMYKDMCMDVCRHV